MWATLREDAVLKGFLAYSAALLVPFFAPLVGVTPPWLQLYSDSLFEVLLLPAVVVAFQAGLGGSASEREKLFWHRITSAVALWWLGQCLFLLPTRWQGVALDLVADTLFFGYYVAFFLAAETYAHNPERAPDDPIRRTQTAGVFLLLSGLAVYLVVVPVMFHRAVYQTWVPSIYMYIVFDAILAARFARLAEVSLDRRWRLVYIVLAATLAFSVGLQFLLLLYVEGMFEWTVRPLDGLWLVPPLGLAVAARLRRHGFGEADESPGPLRSVVQAARLSSPMVLTAFVLPVLHFAGYTFRLLEEDLRGPRQAVVLATVAVMLVLAMREHSFERLHNEELEEKRRKAEQATQKRTTFLNSLIDNSPLAIVVLDAEAAVRISNVAFERLFQYTAAEILGRQLDELILAEDVWQEGRGLTGRILSGESLHVATHRYRKDGTAVDVEFYGVPLVVEDELIGIYALYQDITERNAADEARRESEERFRRLADATFEGIVIVEDGLVLDANEQYARMLRAGAPRKLEGRPLTDFVAAKDHELVIKHLREEYERPFEYRARRLDGTTFYVEALGRSMPHQGRTVRVVAVRDVTDHKRLEEEARQAQKMEAIGRLAGGIAHDFNNLLTVILGHCSILSNRFKATSPSRSHVEEIRRAAGQATMMTQRLLAFGRKQPRQAEIIDLTKVIRSMEKMLRRLVRADIDLIFSLAPRLGLVRADAGQIEQVILNLVINAADAMPEGGRVVVETSSMSLDDTGPHWSLDGSMGPQVQLVVSDTGTGMDAETRARAFEPFFTTKEKGKGTGLGLATVYGIVRQNGGSILVDSAPGLGTSFRIFLPQVFDVPQEPQAEPASAEAADLQGSESILVVEDEAGVRRLAIDFLEIHGYRVLEAEDGDQGLRMVQQSDETIDLVLTDVVMPGMNGPEMAERIAELRPGIQILYMTGYDDGILESSGTGSVRLVQKPFSIEDLLGRVREALDAAKP